MRVCLMVEGQEDVTWDQWLALGRACEKAGLEGLFRSDHYHSLMGGPERGSLDAWTTLGALATATQRIRLGTMVSPVTFRHPALLAKAVVTVDHASGGRAELGIGAGWNELEHRRYGFPFPETKARMDMLTEQIEIVHRSWEEGPFDFRGKHYVVEGLDARPKPVQRPHPNLIMGGRAAPRSVALAARWADEYNMTFVTPEEFAARGAALAKGLERAKRDPASLVLSMMTGCITGSNPAEVKRRTRAVMERMGAGGADEAGWAETMGRQWVIGTVPEVVDRLGEYAKSGMSRVMLQHIAHTDLEMVSLIGAEVVPSLA